MSKINLSTIDKITTFEPTEENLFFIIENDKEAFSMAMLMELALVKSENLTKMLFLYATMEAKGYLKPTVDGTKITRRGRWHRFATHKNITFWGIIIAIILALIVFPWQDLIQDNKQKQKPIKSEEKITPPAPSNISPKSEPLKQKELLLPDTTIRKQKGPPASK